ncbi:MAG: carbohydrate-binding family 9-like protein [Myxococcales bacterium]|nr:carbohydrate-binding family 9-like protein [Myxococcales bacterium]MCB9530906.1 carbohydrate-binding family 9-like protein [Myxococcales bacterium]MCB9534559.1 carbohydrate-binding family 9-like protein [Myxococcales bacterium]
MTRLRLRRLLALTVLSSTAGCAKCSPAPVSGDGEPAVTTPAPSPGTDDIPAPESRTRLPEYTVAKVAEGAIIVDGALDDAAWAAIPWSEALVAPGNGAAVPESPVNGAFKIAFDERALYLAIVVADADAGSPNARDAVDPHIWENASGIELMLQPGNHGDNRGYYEIQVDAAEAVWDTRFDDYNSPIEGDGAARTFGHQEWDAQLERRVTRGDAAELYRVEMALPWTALAGSRAPAPPADGAVWRANIYTFRDGQRAALAWSPILGEGNFHRSSRFGLLRFSVPGADAAEAPTAVTP